MSERYTKRFDLPRYLYQEGAPVIITAGALIQDTQTGQALAQLRLSSLSKETIQAVTVRLTPLDASGQRLGEDVPHRYVGLDAARDDYFGERVPVRFPDPRTCAFSVAVTEVLFADSTIWQGEETPWEPRALPQIFLEEMEDQEAAQHCRTKWGEGSRVLFQEDRDLWRCPCSALNRREEETCHRCGKRRAALPEVDLAAWSAQRAAQREEKKTAAEETRAKRKKWAKIIVPAAVVVVVIGVLLFGTIQKSADYNHAVALMEEEKYYEAMFAFDALGDYKDSEDRHLECSVKMIQQRNEGKLESVRETVLPEPEKWELSFAGDGSMVEAKYFAEVTRDVTRTEILLKEPEILVELDELMEETGATLRRALDLIGMENYSIRVGFYATRDSKTPLATYTKE